MMASITASWGGPDMEERRFCFVNCGLPADQCACYRAQMQAIFADLAAKQHPLGEEFQRVLGENMEDLYEN
jgi:hypothetical protein